MTWKNKRKAPDQPSRKAVKAAFDAFAPLDRSASLPKKPERKGKISDDDAPIFEE